MNTDSIAAFGGADLGTCAAPLVLGAAAWLLAGGGPRASGLCARALLRLGKALVRLAFRPLVAGAEHLPASSGALLVANHVSFADAPLIAACSPRPVRFLVHRSYYERPWIGAVPRLAGAIPVASSDSPDAKQSSLELAARRAAQGELVCIFAEGAITRSGELGSFRRGLETIAGSARVPIVPVALDGLWGSVFSFSGGRALWKWPRLRGRRVRVRFGAPLPCGSAAPCVRAAVASELALARAAR